METKDEALEEIRSLVERHAISLQEIERVTSSSASSRGTGIAVRVFGYLGAIFVLSGLGAYTAMFWDVMDSTSRIIITLGPGLICYILGFLSLGDPRFVRNATPLFLIAALFQPTGLFVAIGEFSSGGDWHLAALLVFGLVAAQQSLTMWAKKRTVLAFTSIWFSASFFITLLDYLNVDSSINCFVIGLAGLLVAYGTDKTRHRAITPYWFFVFGSAFLWASFDLLKNTPLEMLFAGIACACIYLSTALRSRSLLVLGSIALLGYLGYFTSQNFLDSLGWPITLVTMGILLFGVSGASLKIGKKYL